MITENLLDEFIEPVENPKAAKKKSKAKFAAKKVQALLPIVPVVTSPADTDINAPGEELIGVAEVAIAEVEPVDVGPVPAIDSVVDESAQVTAVEETEIDEVPAVSEIAPNKVETVTEITKPETEATETEAIVVEVAETGTVEPVAGPVGKIETTDNAEVVDHVETADNVGAFAKLGLSPEACVAVRKAGYETPTDIQAEIIPHMISGRDVLAQSQTGTGKTAAFALPIVSRVKTGQRKPQVLVLAPTRELAIQVARAFSTYAIGVDRFSVAAIYGGQDYEPQLKQLRRGVEVVVGTPGRVIDHIKRGTLDLSDIKCLVLDEADEMLNMGFLEDVEFVLEHTPAKRQVALFSATLPAPIRNISKRYLNDPARVTIVRKTMTADSIRQRAVFVPHREKVDTLKRFLESEETDGVIVFTRTKDATVLVANQLTRDGLSAAAINGDMPQKNRERTIEQLKSGRLDILVATDVAARGLDVQRISHVFNFDLPEGSESYIHRVGRTGRAGRKGEAIIFLTHTQRSKLRLIERATKQPIEIVLPPTADQMNQMRMKRFKKGIAEVTSGEDLTLFRKLIAEHAEESGAPIELIAAALAHIGQRGMPFLLKDRPKHARRDDNRRDNPGREGSRGRGNNDSLGKGGKDRVLGPPESGMSRYRIEVGRRDGVKVGNIVGAVANEGGIEGSAIGPIKIHGSFSTVDLPKSLPNEVFETLHGARVIGKQLRLRPDTGEGETRFGGGGRSKGRSNDAPARRKKKYNKTSRSKPEPVRRRSK